MSRVTCLVFFAILCQKCSPQNTNVDVTEMGKSVKDIPLGTAQAKTLNLAYNHIAELPEYVFHNKSYKSLIDIELQQNKIRHVHLTAFRGLKQLRHVVLSDNNITALDPYTFKFNPRLERCDLSRNRIFFTRLQVFLVSRTMETLVVSHNLIEQIYEVSFMGLPKLKNLILDYNKLQVIAPNGFKPLGKLQYLSLTNTGVYRLSASMFDSNPPRIVDLQETPLAKRFEPPLKKVTSDAVRNLLRFDQVFFVEDASV